MQAAKRIGPGTKLRHLEVCEFYVWGAIQSKQLALGKVKGTLNCANFLTKHPKSGKEVKQALPGLGMYGARDGEDVLSSTERISVKVSTVTKQHAWKTPVPASVARIANRKDRAGSTALKTKGKCEPHQVVGDSQPDHRSASTGTRKSVKFIWRFSMSVQLHLHILVQTATVALM